MVIKARENSVGAWAFLVGVILAVIIGLSTSLIPIPALVRYSPQIYAVLVILGLIVGFMKFREKDSHTFLIAGAVLVIVSKFGLETIITGTVIGIGIGETVSAIFSALLALFVPATIIVALRNLFSITKI